MQPAAPRGLAAVLRGAGTDSRAPHRPAWLTGAAPDSSASPSARGRIRRPLLRRDRPQPWVAPGSARARCSRVPDRRARHDRRSARRPRAARGARRIRRSRAGSPDVPAGRLPRPRTCRTGANASTAFWRGPADPRLRRLPRGARGTPARTSSPTARSPPTTGCSSPAHLELDAGRGRSASSTVALRGAPTPPRTPAFRAHMLFRDGPDEVEDGLVMTDPRRRAAQPQHRDAPHVRAGHRARHPGPDRVHGGAAARCSSASGSAPASTSCSSPSTRPPSRGSSRRSPASTRRLHRRAVVVPRRPGCHPRASASAVTETAGFYRASGFIDDTRAFLSIPARHDTRPPRRRRLPGRPGRRGADHTARRASGSRTTSSTPSRGRRSSCDRAPSAPADRPPAPVRIVHIGIGAFARAHRLVHRPGRRRREWGISAFTGRSARTSPARCGAGWGLHADRARTRARSGRTHHESVAPSDGSDPGPLGRCSTTGRHALITLTITEAGVPCDRTAPLEAAALRPAAARRSGRRHGVVRRSARARPLRQPGGQRTRPPRRAAGPRRAATCRPRGWLATRCRSSRRPSTASRRGRRTPIALRSRGAAGMRTRRPS